MTDESRIQALEVEMRTLRTSLRKKARYGQFLLCGLACVLVSVVVVSATSRQSIPELIKARQFQVINAAGQTVIELAADKPSAMMTMRGNAGNTVLTLGKGLAGYTGLIIKNRDEIPVAIFGVGKRKFGQLSLGSADGKLVVRLPDPQQEQAPPDS